jgi:hypothetical protein
MPTYRAKIYNTGAPSGGSLLHLVAEGATSTVCGKYPAERMINAGGFDELMCWECLNVLTEERRATK